MDSYSTDDAIELVARREERLEYLKGEQMPPALIENEERLIQEAWQMLTDLLWQNDRIPLKEVFEKLRQERNVAWGENLVQKRVNERSIGSHADQLLERICGLIEETLRSKGIDLEAVRVDECEEVWKQNAPELYELRELALSALRDLEELIRAEEEVRLLAVIREVQEEFPDEEEDD